MLLLTKEHHERDADFSAVASELAATDSEVVASASASGENRRDRGVQCSLLDDTIRPRKDSYSAIPSFVLVCPALPHLTFIYLHPLAFAARSYIQPLSRTSLALILRTLSRVPSHATSLITRISRSPISSWPTQAIIVPVKPYFRIMILSAITLVFPIQHSWFRFYYNFFILIF